MPDWKKLLVPTNAADFWTALSAVASALAVWFAYIAARRAGRALTLEQTPVVNLLRDGDDAELRAVGPGVALNVLLTDDEGEYLASVSVLQSDAAVRATTLRPSHSTHVTSNEP